MSIVPLFPNWIVRHLRSPALHTASWLKRPVEVFLVQPKMTKLEIKSYLRVLYDLPVSKVHTANYRGKARPRAQGKFTKCAAAHAPALRLARPLPTTFTLVWHRRKDPDFKKAYVYLADEEGPQRPRT